MIKCTSLRIAQNGKNWIKLCKATMSGIVTLFYYDERKMKPSCRSWILSQRRQKWVLRIRAKLQFLEKIKIHVAIRLVRSFCVIVAKQGESTERATCS